MQWWNRLSRRQKGWRLLNVVVIGVLLLVLVVDGFGSAVDLLIAVAILLWLPLMFRRAARRSDFGMQTARQDQPRGVRGERSSGDS